MKEELDDELRYPVPHVVTSLDEPVTYAEFFVWNTMYVYMCMWMILGLFKSNILVSLSWVYDIKLFREKLGKIA